MKTYTKTHFSKREARFSSFNYHGFSEGNQNFIYKKGTLPILISSPHATFHSRNGHMKNPELFTGSIGFMLHDYLGVHFIAKCSSDGDDPNYDEISTYKDKVKEVVNENSISLLIDLHGAAARHPFCIEIGTADRKTVSSSTIDTFNWAFSTRSPIEFNIVENHFFNDLNKNNLAHSTHNCCGIETMQLEINRKYRKPYEDFESFVTLSRNLTRFILSYSKR